ncbi:MAG: lamin tail domain-containing protein, partial [Candidatus Heimdallarchaeota archaeon]
MLDSPAYKKGLISIIDISIPILLWKRSLTDSISSLEQTLYKNNSVYVVYTDNLGIFGISDNGADTFWAEGGPLGVSATVTQTHITISTFSGLFYQSEFKGLLKRADNFVTPRDFISKSIGTEIFNSNEILKIIPIDIFNKGSEELLVAFTNGSIKLLNYLSGEIMTITLPNIFSQLSVTTLYYELNKFGFIIATDTNDLFIYDRTNNLSVKSITTPGPVVGDVVTFNLTGKSVDSILIQTEQEFGYMVSIYDIKKELYIWNRTYANKIISLYVGNFDGSNIDQVTHIIALDNNGVARLIELPNVFLAGGEFIHPDLGRWTKLQVTQNSNGLTDVYLGSNYGQIFKYSWDLSGSYTIDKFSATTLGSGQTPSLHITEIMYKPPTSQPDAEWVELYNPTDKAITLEGWNIRDNSQNKFYLSGVIPSGGYIVATKDNDQFRSIYGFDADFEWKNDVPGLSYDEFQEGVGVFNGGNQINFEWFEWPGFTNQYDISSSLGTTLVKNTVNDHIKYTNTEFFDSGNLGTPKKGPYYTKLLISEVYYNAKPKYDS